MTNEIPVLFQNGNSYFEVQLLHVSQITTCASTQRFLYLKINSWMRKCKNEPVSVRQKWKKCSPQLSTRLALLIFPYSPSPVIPQLLSTFTRGGGGEVLAEETVYLSDICGSSSCLFILTPSSFKTTFQTAASQTDYRAKALRRWTHSRVSSLNFMHNLSSSKCGKH